MVVVFSTIRWPMLLCDGEQVSANDADSVEFWIVPSTLGQVMISVSANSSLAADAVQVPLLVKVGL